MADSNSNISRADHIVDVAGNFNTCSDVFGQIGVLLNIIKKELPEYSDAKRLAELAHYMAADFENFADCVAENTLRNGVAGFVGKDFNNLVTITNSEVGHG